MTKIKRGLHTVVYSDNPEAEVAQEPKESTWNTLRKLNDPELQKELDATELRAIKDKDVRFNKEVGAWTNGFYEKYNLGEAHKIRSSVRKEAAKLIKDKDQLNKFMRAKSYEEYTAGPYEKILHRLKDPDYRKEKKNNIYNSQPTLPSIEDPKLDIKKPIKTAQDIQFENFVEQHKQQKAKREYELNNTGIALLKDRLIT
jgi:hypothetical protein